MRQNEKYSREFLFVVAEIDTAIEIARFGINADRAADYHVASKETSVIYYVVSDVVCFVRVAKHICMGWRRIGADSKKRMR